MRATMRIPASLRKLVGGRSIIHVEGSTVREALRHLEGCHPGIWEKLVDPEGNPHRYINVFLDLEDIRFLGGLDSPLKEGSEIVLVAAVAGG